MPSIVTLANGRRAEVTANNWQALALEDNEAEIAKNGWDPAVQAARLTAFKQLAGVDVSEITDLAKGAAASAARVTGNTGVRVAGWISDRAGDGATAFRNGLGVLSVLPDAGYLAAAEGAKTVRIVAIVAGVAGALFLGAYVIRAVK